MSRSAVPPMRIVVVAARFPTSPEDDDGRRLLGTARELVRRGHEVTVLTSRADGRGSSVEEGVRVVRELHAEPEGGLAIAATASDCRRFRRVAAGADVVLYAQQAGLSAALLGVRAPESCGVLCEVTGSWLSDLARSGGNWFGRWERASGSASLRRLAAGALGAPVERPALPPGQAYFVREDERRDHASAGLAGQDPALVRLGIDLERFRFSPPRRQPVRVLYLAEIRRPTGLHTVVLAMGDLPRDARLRAIGDVVDDGYVAEVAELAQAAKVMDRVDFAGRATPAQVREQLAQAHVLVVASEEAGGFPRLVLEAFALGTPVVGTPLGGRAEVLREAETGLVFSPGNSRELSNQLLRLLRDEPLRDRVVRNARSFVETKYALGYTVDQVELLLAGAALRARGGSSGTPTAAGRSNDARAGSRSRSQGAATS